ncbi:toxin-antitoxin system, antitoxin component, Xre family protein [Nodosilinea sp. LEGE 07088]|uniref:toxin-antitoxin system, antitoxin component, Xre family protein n=1 Tax=Nodosilinea sp. LEGE 07088 TaxID=2777968 RepID=UPI0018830AA6|nr:toxin-antitoxin system, antitoxin component, Xre family protein [Nodosilinea sp. LEGE 07088]MBE9136491.1 toxin-antitoxin system, antitoxin component, Xre family protein [Nodosilinea sp. LEGE 07088]
MTLQELIQEAQHLSWQEQFHLAARLLQWAEVKMSAQEDIGHPYSDQSLVAMAAKAAEASFAEVWDNPEDAAYDDL